jgi:hypothetical protein
MPLQILCLYTHSPRFKLHAAFMHWAKRQLSLIGLDVYIG